MGLYDKVIRETCRRLSPLTERLGFVLSPVHFYYPVPATSELRQRAVWDQKTDMAGVAWDLEQQLKHLQLMRPYADECNWPQERDEQNGAYGWNASTFGFSSAMFTHVFVRHFKPRKIIEVGCGWSTAVIHNAAAINTANGNPPVEYTGVEPYPPAYLEKITGKDRIRRMPVQDVSVEELTALRECDILFIDSSHGLSIGSDVQYLYLEVLPRLHPGVVVHIHDIQLPYEYPPHHALKQRWFWNEQYLLQALLQDNSRWEILAAGYALCRDHAAELQEIFPQYKAELHGETGSFWMVRK